METSQTIGKLSTALAKAQGEIRGATKDSTNPHFRSKYADLASVRDAIQDALSKHGIAYVQFPEGGPETVTITTVLACGEEWMRASYSMRPVKADPQGMGSAITYARRYALMAAVGVAPEDDDGNAASRPVQATPANRGNPLRASYEAYGHDIDRCKTREQVELIIESPEFKEFSAQCDEQAKRGGMHFADALRDQASALMDRLPDAPRNPMKEQNAAQSRADVAPEAVLSAGGPPAPFHDPDDIPTDPASVKKWYVCAIEAARGQNKMLADLRDRVVNDPDLFPPDKDELRKMIQEAKARKSA